MKVLSKILAVIFIFSVLFSVCYADVAQYSGESNDFYIDNYDDYYNMISEDEEAIAQNYDEEIKSYYEEYQNYLKDYYNNYERPEMNKARITEAGEAKDDYQINYQTYAINKYVIQPIKAVVLDGPHSGDELDMEYVLSADSYNNIILAELKKGDTVFVLITENEDGTISGNISNSWSTVERTGSLLVIGIIAIILLLVYGGNKGFSTSLVVIMAIIFASIVIPNFAFDGKGVVLVGILEILCLIFTITIIHLGVNRKSLRAMGISVVISAVAFALVMLFNYLLRLVGTSFEYAAIAENIILGNISFEQLYIITTLIISAAFISNTVGMSVRKIEREGLSDYSEKVKNARVALPANIIPMAVTCLTLYIPNHILLLSNKFSDPEIVNAETFVTELVRVIVIALCCTLVAPIVSINKLGFGTKYLKEADEKNEDNTNNGVEDREEIVEKEEIKKEVKEVVEEKVEEIIEEKEEKTEEKKEEKPKRKTKGKSKSK